jgi:hypothetical protein
MPGLIRRSVFLSFALSSLFSVLAAASSTRSLDSAWKPYFNPQGKYCVSYPAKWYRADAFEGSGLYVMVGVKKHSRATGEIDVAFFSGPAAVPAHAATVSLNDNFQSHVEGLKRFERAERIQVLDQHPLEVAGNAALLTKDQYYDPQDRSTWTEEVLFVMRGKDVYRVELECKADQLKRFEPVFSHLISTLQFDCTAPR